VRRDLWMTGHLGISCESRVENLLDKGRDDRRNTHQEERRKEAGSQRSHGLDTSRARGYFYSEASFAARITGGTGDH
jgi:hypothetical protein